MSSVCLSASSNFITVELKEPFSAKSNKTFSEFSIILLPDKLISFNLTLYAHTAEELTKIYAKMNKLTSLCYPEYAKDDLLSGYLSTKDANQNVTKSVSKTRMKPPLTKFRLGEMFGTTNNELLGFIETISYSIPEGSTWETESGARVPKHIFATLTYKVIHGEVPGLYNEKGDEYSFYGITDSLG